MKLKVIEDSKLLEDRIEIYCHKKTPIIEAVIQLVEEHKPNWIGLYNEEKQVLDIDEIDYFEAVDKRCFAYLEKKVFEVKYTLLQIEDFLSPYGFIRINKSNIVSIYKIEKIKCATNMHLIVVLANGKQLIISRHYKKLFEAYLKSKRGVCNMQKMSLKSIMMTICISYTMISMSVHLYEILIGSGDFKQHLNAIMMFFCTAIAILCLSLYFILENWSSLLLIVT